MDGPAKAIIRACISVNAATSTRLMCDRVCAVYSVRKVYAIANDAVKEHRGGITTKTIDNIVAHVMMQKGYGRINGGMLICALAKYTTREYWAEWLENLQSAQLDEILWTEPFIYFASEHARGHSFDHDDDPDDDHDDDPDDDHDDEHDDDPADVETLIDDMLGSPEWHFLPYAPETRLATLVFVD